MIIDDHRTRPVTARALAVALAGGLALLLAAAGGEALTFDVSFPTWGFAPGTTVGLAFQLTDGAGFGDGNNTVTIGDFAFGGGTPLAPGCNPALCAGGGHIATSPLVATLTDTGFFNAAIIGFLTGSSGPSLRVTMTTHVSDAEDPTTGGTPDQWSFFLLDASGFPFPTDDPTGSGALLVLDITSRDLGVGDLQRFSSPSVGLAIEGPAAPTPSLASPGAFGLLGLGLGGVGVRAVTQRRRASRRR
jgi:hypothetical protein